MEKETLLKNCYIIIEAYNSGKLGQTNMPEDSNPKNFETKELRLSYFALPMALNYQRDSYKLWESALKTYNDPTTKIVFDVKKASQMGEGDLRNCLTKYKLALQPNKHIKTWKTIASTISNEFGSFSNLINQSEGDFLKLQELIQKRYKKGFPYLSGPKIFNYWSFILTKYGGKKLKNAQVIEIAPDTHVTQCSVLLGVITKEEAETLSKQKISERWRELLKNSKLNPIDMHSPLWFWSRNGFIFKLT